MLIGAGKEGNYDPNEFCRSLRNALRRPRAHGEVLPRCVLLADVGLDIGSFSNDYESPNPFTGMIKKVEIHLEPEPTNRTDIDQIQKVEEATERAAQ
jgi:hypothetical protein